MAKRTNKDRGLKGGFRQSRARNSAQPPGVPSRPEEVVGMRLNKYVAHCGIASRRVAADYVKAGRIKVNGEVQIDPSYQIRKGDKVYYLDKLIQPEERKVYILLNKPKDVLTTSKDEHGRRTVLDLLEGKVRERVFPVGRLDRDTTGLLLLTNDGDLAKKLTHPSHRVPKVYQVTLNRVVTKADLEKIRAGVDLEDGPMKVDWINYVEDEKRDTVSLEIHSGRNRVVRRLFEHLGYEVRRLDRIYLAGLTKKDLPRGYFRYLTEQEIIRLKHFVH